MKTSFLFILILCCVSCAKSTEEEVRSAVVEAKYHLSGMDCSKAEDILNDVGFQKDDANYISVYASMQACKAGYKELDILFGGNLENINSASLITSLASFSSSNETAPDSTVYLSLNNAINTLISYDDAASGQPSTVARNAKFGTKKSGDLSLQALYLIFVQMGKHFALYGNAGADGAKGGDAQGFGNTCIYSYTTEDAEDWITATSPGTCVPPLDGTQGSDFLEAPVGQEVIKRRLCYGIIYYNNMMDILSNMTLPGSSELGDVSNIQAALALLMDNAVLAEDGAFNDGDPNGQDAITTLKDITDQTTCEAQTIERIEKFYAIFFESIYQ